MFASLESHRLKNHGLCKLSKKRRTNGGGRGSSMVCIRTACLGPSGVSNCIVKISPQASAWTILWGSHSREPISWQLYNSLLCSYLESSLRCSSCLQLELLSAGRLITVFSYCWMSLFTEAPWDLRLDCRPLLQVVKQSFSLHLLQTSWCCTELCVCVSSCLPRGSSTPPRVTALNGKIVKGQIVSQLGNSASLCPKHARMGYGWDGTHWWVIQSHQEAGDHRSVILLQVHLHVCLCPSVNKVNHIWGHSHLLVTLFFHNWPSPWITAFCTYIHPSKINK